MRDNEVKDVKLFSGAETGRLTLSLAETEKTVGGQRFEEQNNRNSY